jgi:osmotically-inducible protein OsmY
MKKLAILLCFSLFMTGCVPAALVIGATAGGAIVYDQRSMRTMVQDKDAASIASNLIFNSPDLRKNTHIVISVFDHVMLLAGQAPTQEMRLTVYNMMLSVKNVTRIYNEITVEPKTSIWRRTQDAWITTKAKSEMLTKKGLESTQIKVITENSVVYLMGIVTHKQATMAADVARRIKGVTKVVEVFEYPQ